MAREPDAERGATPDTDKDREEEAAHGKAAQRVGFMMGEGIIPENFDRLAEAAIKKMSYDE